MSSRCLSAGLTGLGLGNKTAYLTYLTQIDVSAKNAFRFVLSVHFYGKCYGHHGKIGKSCSFGGFSPDISNLGTVLEFYRDFISQYLPLTSALERGDDAGHYELL